MNRTVLLLLIASVAVMVVASGAMILQGQQEPAAIGRGALRPWLMLALALVLGLMLGFMQRQLASTRPKASDDHRRHAQSAALMWYLLMAAWWGWVALRTYEVVPPAPMGRETFLRGVIVFLGVALAVRGNFFGKIAPPTGDHAPDAAVWTRAALRTGWVLALLGLVLVVSAIALPMGSMVFIFPPALLAMIVLIVQQRRVMRSGRSAGEAAR